MLSDYRDAESPSCLPACVRKFLSNCIIRRKSGKLANEGLEDIKHLNKSESSTERSHERHRAVFIIIFSKRFQNQIEAFGNSAAPILKQHRCPN